MDEKEKDYKCCEQMKGKGIRSKDKGLDGRREIVGSSFPLFPSLIFSPFSSSTTPLFFSFLFQTAYSHFLPLYFHLFPPPVHRSHPFSFSSHVRVTMIFHLQASLFFSRHDPLVFFFTAEEPHHFASSRHLFISSSFTPSSFHWR